MRIGKENKLGRIHKLTSPLHELGRANYKSLQVKDKVGQFEKIHLYMKTVA